MIKLILTDISIKLIERFQIQHQRFSTNMAAPPTQPQDLHVLIIGSGITGLVLAQALGQVNKFIRAIFERRKFIHG
jgi:NADH dehydrogenase FAD-containing subunit